MRRRKSSWKRWAWRTTHKGAERMCKNATCYSEETMRSKDKTQAWHHTFDTVDFSRVDWSCCRWLKRIEILSTERCLLTDLFVSKRHRRNSCGWRDAQESCEFAWCTQTQWDLCPFMVVAPLSTIGSWVCSLRNGKHHCQLSCTTAGRKNATSLRPSSQVQIFFSLSGYNAILDPTASEFQPIVMIYVTRWMILVSSRSLISKIWWWTKEIDLRTSNANSLPERGPIRKQSTWQVTLFALCSSTRLQNSLSELLSILNRLYFFMKTGTFKE